MAYNGYASTFDPIIHLIRKCDPSTLDRTIEQVRKMLRDRIREETRPPATGKRSDPLSCTFAELRIGGSLRDLSNMRAVAAGKAPPEYIDLIDEVRTEMKAALDACPKRPEPTPAEPKPQEHTADCPWVIPDNRKEPTTIVTIDTDDL